MVGFPQATSQVLLYAGTDVLFCDLRLSKSLDSGCTCWLRSASPEPSAQALINPLAPVPPGIPPSRSPLPREESLIPLPFVSFLGDLQTAIGLSAPQPSPCVSMIHASLPSREACCSHMRLSKGIPLLQLPPCQTPTFNISPWTLDTQFSFL